VPCGLVQLYHILKTENFARLLRLQPQDCPHRLLLPASLGKSLKFQHHRHKCPHNHLVPDAPHPLSVHGIPFLLDIYSRSLLDENKLLLRTQCSGLFLLYRWLYTFCATPLRPAMKVGCTAYDFSWVLELLNQALSTA